ncbi:MAG TPA: serine/threonine-protein kinase [Candidatus Obscuribacterales bacterium]
MNSESLETIGAYCLVQLLAARPGREVWLAQTETQEAPTPRPVIVKILDPAGMEAWKDLELFEREARILQALDYPGIPACLAHFSCERQDRPLYVLVESHLPGQTLAARLEQGWRPDENAVRDLARQLLQILAHLHQHHPPLVHRDIKPSNLLLDPSGQLWLLDFGAVSDLIKPQGGSTVVGTFGYMAPEQAMGRSGPASDLYGLGATLLHLLSGSPPDIWPRRGFELLLEPRLFDPGLGSFWLGYLQQLLAVKPAERFASATEALTALEQPLAKRRKRRAERLSFHQGEGHLQVLLPARKKLGYGLMLAFSLILAFPWPPVTSGSYNVVLVHPLAGSFYYLMSLCLALTLYLALGYRPSLWLDQHSLRVGPLLRGIRQWPQATDQIQRIEVFHNPYRCGLRLELRTRRGQLHHRVLDLRLERRELELVRSELTRTLRRIQERV